MHLVIFDADKFEQRFASRLPVNIAKLPTSQVGVEPFCDYHEDLEFLNPA
jgi:hypothetical protein